MFSVGMFQANTHLKSNTCNEPLETRKKQGKLTNDKRTAPGVGVLEPRPVAHGHCLLEGLSALLL